MFGSLDQNTLQCIEMGVKVVRMKEYKGEEQVTREYYSIDKVPLKEYIRGVRQQTEIKEPKEVIELETIMKTET